MPTVCHRNYVRRKSQRILSGLATCCSSEVSLRRVGIGVAAAPGQEAEIAALVGLGDVLGVQGAVAALELRPRGLPLFGAGHPLTFGNIKGKQPGSHVQGDEITRLDESQRAADERL